MRPRSLLTGAAWIAGSTAALLVSAAVVFGMTDDTIRGGEQSEWVTRFVESAANDPEPVLPTPRTAYPSAFGGPGPARALVLYDDGAPAARGELYAIAAANLATHFGQVQALLTDDYEPGLLADYDAAIYVGSSPGHPLPTDLVADLRAGEIPVLWLGRNIQSLSGEPGSSELASFVERHGWDPTLSVLNLADEVTTIVYKDQELDRDSRTLSGLLMPQVVEPDSVEVLATAVCGPVARPHECSGWTDSEFAWALRSGNLTYVSEIPFDYLTERSRYLALADLYYDLLAPDTEPVQRAAVRLEDVGPESNPHDLRRIADYLHSQGVPFQVAVIPIHIAKVPGADPVRWFGVSLADRPAVVRALKYMQERGGTLIQHGTTHQYGALDNPYDGSSGADFEFYRAGCSPEEHPPYRLEPCEQDSWVQLTEPVGQDEVAQHAARIEVGRQVMIDAGLGEPTIFEVPHYAASANAYEAITQVYGTRYERSQYFAGLLSGETYEGDPAFTQLFPYRVHDIYGATVLPENLGNVAEHEQNNHPARPPQFLVDNAEANLVVRESTASFFFHPFLDTAYLDEVVTGIKELGYTFVPVDELP